MDTLKERYPRLGELAEMTRELEEETGISFWDTLFLYSRGVNLDQDPEELRRKLAELRKPQQPGTSTSFQPIED